MASNPSPRESSTSCTPDRLGGPCPSIGRLSSRRDKLNSGRPTLVNVIDAQDFGVVGAQFLLDGEAAGEEEECGESQKPYHLRIIK